MGLGCGGGSWLVELDCRVAEQCPIDKGTRRVVSKAVVDAAVMIAVPGPSSTMTS